MLWCPSHLAAREVDKQRGARGMERKCIMIQWAKTSNGVTFWLQGRRVDVRKSMGCYVVRSRLFVGIRDAAAYIATLLEGG